MKYWGYLIVKLVVALFIMAAAGAGIRSLFAQQYSFFYSHPERFAHDLVYTSAMMLYWLFCSGLLYLVIWDQKYRCRTCLRRLRMPVTAGSWPNMFLIGKPRVEYICLYGHGTLKVPEVDLTGSKRPDWQPHCDMWKELESLEETRK